MDVLEIAKQLAERAEVHEDEISRIKLTGDAVQVSTMLLERAGDVQKSVVGARSLLTESRENMAELASGAAQVKQAVGQLAGEVDETVWEGRRQVKEAKDEKMSIDAQIKKANGLMERLAKIRGDVQKTRSSLVMR